MKKRTVLPLEVWREVFQFVPFKCLHMNISLVNGQFAILVQPLLDTLRPRSINKLIVGEPQFLNMLHLSNLFTVPVCSDGSFDTLMRNIFDMLYRKLLRNRGNTFSANIEVFGMSNLFEVVKSAESPKLFEHWDHAWPFNNIQIGRELRNEEWQFTAIPTVPPSPNILNIKQLYINVIVHDVINLLSYCTHLSDSYTVKIANLGTFYHSLAENGIQLQQFFDAMGNNCKAVNISCHGNNNKHRELLCHRPSELLRLPQVMNCSVLYLRHADPLLFDLDQLINWLKWPIGRWKNMKIDLAGIKERKCRESMTMMRTLIRTLRSDAQKGSNFKAAFRVQLLCDIALPDVEPFEEGSLSLIVFRAEFWRTLWTGIPGNFHRYLLRNYPTDNPGPDYGCPTEVIIDL